VPAGDCLQKNEIFQRLRPLKSRQHILRKMSNAMLCSDARLEHFNLSRSMTMNDLRVNELFEMEPFEDAFRRLLRPWRSDLQDRGAPQIKVDVAETDMNYTLKAEVPGVRKEDIEVRIDGNQVNISAEVKKESEEKKDGRVIRSERRYGYASRSLWLDSPVDDAKAQAKYNNGVLELTLPKKAATSTKRLAIE